MKKPLKIFLTILSIIIVLGAFISSCTCTYIFNLNITAFWWSWFLITWLIDIFVGGYIFYKKNRTDETKTFWLFVMVVLPVLGGFLALIHNYKLKTLYTSPNNDHTSLQILIFKARKSIKIYTNSLFVSMDTFKALNFACWNGVKVEIILTNPKKKSKQEFTIHTLQKYLEKEINLYLIDKSIDESFILVDNDEFLITPKNFDFRNIYAYKLVHSNGNINKLINTWNYDIERSSAQSLEKEKVNPFKNLKFKLINIFYSFF